MNGKDKLFELVNQLKNLFIYHSGILKYNEKFQFEINELMNELGNFTGTFNINIKNETTNIRNELTIIDKKTGEKKELVNIESMAQRVKNVNNKNNIYSCLKTLALSNKIAHVYDGNIQKCKNKFISYYNEIFPDKKIDDVNFMRSLNLNFPELIGRNKYNFDIISDNEFDKIWHLLTSNNSKINKGTKISVLKSLNIEFNIKNDDEINNKFGDLCDNKWYVGSSYLIKKFKEGQDFIKFENKMFAIKDFYISMIGQLLCKNQFKNIPYQLVKTPDATPGFEYMLIIDDKDLSYYIEVHMPNFIATKLIKKYQMKYSKERSFKKLGASAIYCREKDEIKNIFESIKNGDLNKNNRAQIISRDYIETSSGGMGVETDENSVATYNDSEKKADKQDSSYEFITNEITYEPSLFEKFLMDDELYHKTMEDLKSNYFNENVSIKEINLINKQEYKYIYDNFNNNYKMKFINYSLNQLKNSDVFDKKLYNKIYKNISYNNIDNISKLLIDLNDLKYDFVKNNKNELAKYLNKINEDKYNIDDNKYIINQYIEDYLDEKFDDFNIISRPNRRK